MRWQTTRSRASNIVGGDVPWIQVTGLYEDLEAELRAKALIECVHSGMHLPVRFRLDFWRFDWLRERSLREIALSSARGSALVLVSVSHARSLPPQMGKWVAAWAQEKNDQPSAMILLLPKGKNGLSPCHPLYEPLERAAEQKSVDFFHEFYEPQPARRRPGRNHVGREVGPADSRFAAMFGRPAGGLRSPLSIEAPTCGFMPLRQPPYMP